MDDLGRPGPLAGRLRSGVGRPRPLAELALLAVVYGGYTLSRNGVPTAVAEAVRNGRALLLLEHATGMDVELALNHAAVRFPAVAVTANYYYATLHFVLTATVLVWLYRRRPLAYRRHRRVLLFMTVLALVGYWLYPVAPPRLLPGGDYVDTLRVFGTWGADPDDPVVPVSNQYAAMPSMHVGWALWVGATLVRRARQRAARVLGACYPVATVVVVVVTANHYLLDVLGALVVFAAGVVIAHALDEPGPDLPSAPGAALAPGRADVQDLAHGRPRPTEAVGPGPSALAPSAHELE